MGWGDLLKSETWLGGSHNPADYAKQTQYQDSGQIHGIINQGLAGANQAAPTADLTQSNQFRNMQMGQAQQLAGIASGQQKGAGELAVQRQVSQALAAQQAQARMARGGNAALAAREGARNSAGLGLAGVGQAQQAAMQDQMNAQGLLSQTLQGARGQDQQTSLANLQAQLQQRGMNNEQIAMFLQQLTGMNANQLAAQTQLAANPQQGLLGSAISAGGQILGGYLGKPG